MRTQKVTTGPRTPRLFHRAFEVADAPVFLRLRSDPEVVRYTGDEPMHTEDEARRAIESYPDFEEVGFGRWAIGLRDTGEVIGFGGLKYLPELDEVDLGYRLVPEHWGHGYATESSLACVRFGFEALGLQSIIGLVHPENRGSVRVLEKVGMRFEGPVQVYGEEALQYRVRRPPPR